MKFKIDYSYSTKPGPEFFQKTAYIDAPSAPDAISMFETNNRSRSSNQTDCKVDRIEWVAPEVAKYIDEQEAVRTLWELVKETFAKKPQDQTEKRIQWNLSGQDAVYVRRALTELAAEESGNWERLKDIRELLHSLDEASVFRK